MAFNHPDADNSDVHEVVYVRSSMPTGDPSTFDDQLNTIDEYVEMKANNHIFHPEMKTKNDVITKILKGHPLNPTLTEAVSVPPIFVQRFWKHS